MHPGAERQRIQSFGIARPALQALQGKRTRARNGILERFDAAGIGRARNAAEKALVIEEVVAGQDLLQEELLKKITSGQGDLAEWLGWVLRGPFLEEIARFVKLLFVQKVITLFEFGNRRESRARGFGGTPLGNEGEAKKAGEQELEKKVAWSILPGSKESGKETRLPVHGLPVARVRKKDALLGADSSR